MKMPATAGGRKGRGGMPTTLFGGLLRCGRCGGSVVAVNAYRYGCAAAKDRGKSVCIGIGARKRDVDSALLTHLRDEILAPATIARIEREAIRLSSALDGQAGDVAGESRRQAREVEAEVGRLVEAIAAVGTSPALTERLRIAETRLDEIKRSTARTSVATLPSAIRAHVRSIARGIDEAAREHPVEARTALRQAFGDIQLVEREGTIFAAFEDTAERLLLAVGGQYLGRVAGAGFEPATFGL